MILGIRTNRFDLQGGGYKFTAVTIYNCTCSCNIGKISGFRMTRPNHWRPKHFWSISKMDPGKELVQHLMKNCHRVYANGIQNSFTDFIRHIFPRRIR